MTDSKNKKAFSDRTLQIADLTVKLMKLFPREPRDRSIQGFGFDQPFLNSEFEAARLKAEALLDEIETPRAVVDAYQLFEEGVEYSAKEIVEVFSEAKWDGLKSKKPVEELLVRLRHQFDRERQENYNSIPGESRELAEAVLCALEEISGMDGVETCFHEFRRHMNEFIVKLRNDFRRLTEMESFGEWQEFESFTKWCFPIDRSKDVEVRHYRAHEIFRYAAKMRWESVKLTRDLAKIEGIPSPKVHPSRMSRFEQFDEHCEIFPCVEPPVFPKAENAPDSDINTDQS
ncbi:MAG: hypothetical protein WD342_07100 [Verrucomicrobiales bacterium]